MISSRSEHMISHFLEVYAMLSCLRMLLFVLRAARSREDCETQYPRMNLTISNMISMMSALKAGSRNQWDFLLEMGLK